jgi:hypothetical protein
LAVCGIPHAVSRLFEFNPGPVEEMKQYLEFVSAKWDEALGRLQAFVER